MTEDGFKRIKEISEIYPQLSNDNQRIFFAHVHAAKTNSSDSDDGGGDTMPHQDC